VSMIVAHSKIAICEIVNTVKWQGWHLTTSLTNQNCVHKDIKGMLFQLVLSTVSPRLPSKYADIHTYVRIYNVTNCFVWVQNLVCYVKERTK
jgi:hypothetical protein